MANNISARVTAGELGQFVGKTVRVVGRVAQVNGTDLHLQDAQGTTIIVAHDGAPQHTEGTVEAVGTVQADLRVKHMMSTRFAEGFDLAMYEEAVQQMRRFPELYPVAAAVTREGCAERSVSAVAVNKRRLRPLREGRCSPSVDAVKSSDPAKLGADERDSSREAGVQFLTKVSLAVRARTSWPPAAIYADSASEISLIEVWPADDGYDAQAFAVHLVPTDQPPYQAARQLTESDLGPVQSAVWLAARPADGDHCTAEPPDWFTTAGRGLIGPGHQGGPAASPHFRLPRAAATTPSPCAGPGRLWRPGSAGSCGALTGRLSESGSQEEENLRGTQAHDSAGLL
eukprot:CAMPEP_0205998330 /NCGR_PEP_ID=MMETSP1464-20131121/180_1 /ASSEMBLY_ACC=CAM_ASM_001124 /TAXON_ID=119497 /ORGANISM="Exanthemachrysis gayraliae, Strain RCC1523" /LENGTH=342 /DNA_ID=CAMNT_0053371473 /DNA_START=25 /DNA_END=1055 /DNA_ORIENTATION=+